MLHPAKQPNKSTDAAHNAIRFIVFTNPFFECTPSIAKHFGIPLGLVCDLCVVKKAAGCSPAADCLLNREEEFNTVFCVASLTIAVMLL